MSCLDDEKLFYERFWALHGNSDLVQVFKDYGPSIFRRSSVLEGFEAFIDHHQFKGGFCLEIGTLHGLTAIVLARRFHAVVSIDVVDSPFKRKIAADLGLTNITFVDVKNNAEKATLIGSLDFDAAYVDADHARDTQADFELVRRCGRVLFHEYWPAQLSVTALVDQLRGQGTIDTKGKLALWTNCLPDTTRSPTAT